MSGVNKRLRYVDAMRGLAILLVVFSHVTNAYVKMPITNASFSGVYYMMTMFRMPLFFFVSGFFAFRMAEKWTWPTVRRVMTKKFQAQIVGLSVFCFLFGACMKGWRFQFIWTSNPYWFTISLFEMFVVYLAAALTVRRTRSNAALYILLALSFTAPFVFNFLTDGVKLPKWVVGLQTWHTLNYWPYFMTGIFARRFEAFMWRATDNQYFKALMIVGFFSLVLFYGCRHRYSLEWDFVMTAMRFTGLMTVLIAFRSYRAWFDKGTPVSNCMSFVGSRTLDIYYLHYFFIPDLGFMKGWMSQGPGNHIVVMLTVGLVISAIVIVLCLLISAILRSSPFLASWLFGQGEASARRQCLPQSSLSRSEAAKVSS